MQKTVNSLDLKFRKHMAQQGIATKAEIQGRLQQIFETACHQNSALIGVYKLFMPEWDRIERLEGFPEIGQEMWQYICNLFIDFDQRNHHGILNGGIWVSNGFSSSSELGPWEISLDCCNVIYK